MNPPPHTCPSCRSSSHVCLGPIPRAFHFCSHRYDRAINVGSLCRCIDCGLHFRSPCLNEDELIELYESIEGKLWGGASNAQSPARNDFVEISNLLDRIAFEGSNICDIGCFSGDLLMFLQSTPRFSGAKLNLYGIEPSTKGAEIATSRGIKILGPTTSSLSTVVSPFDAIFCVDVFEHLCNPKQFLRECANALKPNGVLVVVTGAIDSAFLRKWGSKSYYVAMPEHTIFLSENYARSITGIDLRLDEYIVFRRRMRSLTNLVRTMPRNVLFALLDIAGKMMGGGLIEQSLFLRSLASRGISNSWSFPDHAIACFRKC